MSKKTKNKDAAQEKLIAKRDFTIHRNSDHFDIKEGDDLHALGVPSIYFENLKTANVI